MENSGVTAVVVRPARPMTWFRPLRCDASHARSKIETMEWRCGHAGGWNLDYLVVSILHFYPYLL